MRFIEKCDGDKPYWVVELPDEQSAKMICSRSVALKSCIELWSSAKTEYQLHKNLKSALENKTGQWLAKSNGSMDEHVCPSALIEACCPANKSFKVEVETFCKHVSMKEKIEKIEVRFCITFKFFNEFLFGFSVVVIPDCRFISEILS